MIKPFDTLYTDIQNQTGDDSSAFLTQIKRWINETQHMVLADHPWKFLEKTGNITTENDTDRYALQGDCRKIITVTTTPDSGTTVYRPDPVEDADQWEYLQSLDTSVSDQPQYYYQEGNDLLLYPGYDTAGHTITVRYRKRVIDMSRAVYSTGTIVTATLGDETIVGSGTSWTTRKPVGEQWIRIAQTAGDYQWYKVDSITDATNLELETNYQGVSIAAGTSSYELAEAPAIKAGYHDLCFYRPMALNYMRLENPTMASYYWNLYDGGYELGKVNRPGGLLKKLIVEEAGMLDTGFYTAPSNYGPATPEDISRTKSSTFG